MSLVELARGTPIEHIMRSRSGGVLGEHAYMLILIVAFVAGVARRPFWTGAAVMSVCTCLVVVAESAAADWLAHMCQTALFLGGTAVIMAALGALNACTDPRPSGA